MGELRGFLKLARQGSAYRQVCERVKDFKEVIQPPGQRQSQEQASRCMDCGTPFCHWGCPVGNYIPEWNDYVFRGNWKEALVLLDATNNLPEITGRVCPALCEYSCVLGLNDDAVTIRENELAVIEFGFKNGWIKPKPVSRRTGKKIAIIGSGPAGLSCAAELNQAGHQVTIFERDNLIGGILRYGIPDFKLEKYLLERRIDIWKEEGIIFKAGVNVGQDYPADKILVEFDALCLAGGSRVPRDINIEGRNLKGIYFAMDYLVQSNKRVTGEKIPPAALIDARDRNVVVLGGGDTGSDCVGTALRQGARCVTQVEILPQPAQYRTREYPWPKYPVILKTSSSHEEGGTRYWSVSAKKFIGERGRVKKILCENAEGEIFEIDADLIVIAAGFLHPEHSGLLSELKVAFDQRGNVKTGENYLTSVEKVFCAGDMRRGQSLVVWAISEGRRAAYFIDKYLMGEI
ncbi:MAG: glutamate synthase subunit beta [Candidatus Omnitrophica bacterium]|nr:glutamate synthase subunit beta [Candidatus Omnitrophota bacterium]